jgi:TRAP-type uncharacterized transport system fused permease subunit
MAKQALVAVLAATWIVGLFHQVSLPMAVAYIVISTLMAGLIFANSRVLKFAPRRKDRGR